MQINDTLPPNGSNTDSELSAETELVDSNISPDSHQRSIAEDGNRT